MAQHDYIISNQSGAAFRADLNNGLAAIVSQNSGAAQPSTTYAYQWWADTTTGLLKIRNAANSAWITVGTLASANLGLATLVSPTFTGTPAAPTASAGTNTTQLATTAFVLANAVDVTGDTMTGNLTVPSLNGGPLAGFRNIIINGNPTINQRGYVSGTATSGATQYTLDRWQVVTSGQSISWTDSANVRTVTAPAGGVQQIIEGASIVSGTYTLNWTGTATALVGGGAVAKGGSVTLVAGTDINVRFSSGTFSLVQLEPGSVATPFERRPIGAELALCQRYAWFPGISYPDQSYASTGGSNLYTQVYFPVTMRVAPTITASWSAGTNATSGAITALGAHGANAQLTSSALGEFSATINWTSFNAEL